MYKVVQRRLLHKVCATTKPLINLLSMNYIISTSRCFVCLNLISSLFLVHGQTALSSPSVVPFPVPLQAGSITEIDLMMDVNEFQKSIMIPMEKRLGNGAAFSEADWFVLETILREDIPNINFYKSVVLLDYVKSTERIKRYVPVFIKLCLNEGGWSNGRQKMRVDEGGRSLCLLHLASTGDVRVVEACLQFLSELSESNLDGQSKKQCEILVNHALRQLGYDFQGVNGE